MYTHERSIHFNHHCCNSFGILQQGMDQEQVLSQETYQLHIDDQFNSDKREREKEIDRLLSKMGKNGINDLSAKDRKRLDELSKM